MNDLGKNLELTHERMEILGSRLKTKGQVEEGVTTTLRNVTDDFRKTFAEDEHTDRNRRKQKMAYLNNLEGLFELLERQHEVDEWRLFIDSNKKSLKFVLLHNENKFPSIILAYRVDPKESYEDFEKILTLIKYDEYLCGK